MTGRTVRSIATCAAAGLLATAPMTAAMELGFRLLPAPLQYPLPPREVTDALAGATGFEPDERQESWATLAAHFAYGGAVGSAFAAVPARGFRGAAIAGAGYGLFIWLISYSSLLPALRLLEPVEHHPKERTALMITAHVVWGGCLGVIARALRAGRLR
jgi:uncharacterized membrane protein YagU involved in acid resistance